MGFLDDIKEVLESPVRFSEMVVKLPLIGEIKFSPDDQDRLREKALQNYLDHMARLMLGADLRTQGRVGDIARVRTLTVLRRLDGVRKGNLLRFLYESDLITKDKVVIVLRGADLSGANLAWARLSGADLSGVDLSRADLSRVNLSGADLIEAKLSGAKLTWANLGGANLSVARLSGADLSGVNLSGAKLIGADLSEADFYYANFFGTRLTGAKLDGAKLTWASMHAALDLTQEQLDLATGDALTILPDGLTRPKRWGKSVRRALRRALASHPVARDETDIPPGWALGEMGATSGGVALADADSNSSGPTGSASALTRPGQGEKGSGVGP